MREADELQNDFRSENFDVPGDITFHNALVADFFAFWNPKLNNRDDPPSDFDRTEIDCHAQLSSNTVKIDPLKGSK